MVPEELPRDVIFLLQEKYPTQDSRKELRLNEELIQEILELVESKDYEIVPARSFPTENISSLAIESFEQALRTWVQGVDFESYIPSEQILRDLIVQGWIIKPPEGSY